MKHSKACGRWIGLGLGALLCWALGCRDAAVIVGTLHVPAAGGGAGFVNAADGGRSGRSGAGGAGAVDAGAASSTRTGSGRAGANPPHYDTGIEPGTRDQFCAGEGLALRSVRSGSSADCDYRVEQRLFAYALCACDALSLSGKSFAVDSFDSSQGAYKAGQTGSAIGVNGSLAQVASDTQVLGSLTVSGAGTLQIAGQNFLVTGDLETNAVLQWGASSQRVGRDLWLGDDVSNTGVIQIDRDVHQSPGHSGLDGLSIGGQRDVTEDVRVSAPCACGDTGLDVRALVAQARDQNDDAAAGFTADALMLDTFTTDLKDLPCGRLFVSGLELQALSTYIVSASSRTALFIQGDLHVAAPSTLFVKAFGAGELDVFVGGDLRIEQNGSLVLGDASRPSAVRLYVAGQVELDGGLALAAHVYAPQSAIKIPDASGAPDSYGSVLARSIDFAAPHMHYDRSILHAAAECKAPAPQRCDDCGQCPDDLACQNGSCGACTSDTDCCEPAVCASGTCQMLVSTWP